MAKISSADSLLVIVFDISIISKLLSIVSIAIDGENQIMGLSLFVTLTCVLYSVIISELEIRRRRVSATADNVEAGNLRGQLVQKIQKSFLVILLQIFRKKLTILYIKINLNS